MPCFSPIQAWVSGKTATGKRAITFQKQAAATPETLNLPCGRCVGCRLERSRQWAVRCVHEASLNELNCFITLTYEKLPEDGSLDKTEFQRFMKRLRKRVGPVRFYHCGEYGEKNGRPHYHALLFGYDFPDRVFLSEKNGIKSYTSEILSQLWPLGFSAVGDVTFESAAYVARYILKKINGELSDEHYSNKDTGVIKQSEYTTMSRRPGIGKLWFDKFKTDVFPSDEVIVRGKQCSPPRYYGDLLDKLDPMMYEMVKSIRKENGKRLSSDNDSFRLKVKEECVESKIKQLVRPLEVMI